MSDRPALFGVTASVTGRRWLGPDAAVERLGLAIAQAAEVPEIVGRVLAARGVLPEDAVSYLEPRLRDLMPDPSMLADMDVAAERLVRAVRDGQAVAIFGDYDVDGAASAALLRLWLGAMGTAATVYIPDRIDEGYGPNVPAMQALSAAHDLIVCVDCGTLSHEPLAAARDAGAEVIVVDHHLAGETLPPAVAVVNPNRHDDASAQGHLCAAGVVFLLLVAANRLIRVAGGREVPLIDLLDLVAVATVADVAPLIGLNRAFVRQGLAVLARRGRPGLAALADVARLRAPPGSRDLGFVLGPRINAGGRVGRAGLGVELLTTADPAVAARLAAELDLLNEERRRIEAEVLDAAIRQVETRDPAAPLAWAAGPGWHPGVVGIVAARLKERFNRPAVVIGIDAGEGKGSGRSIPGVDLGSAVGALAREGVLIKGGGHRMAAGLTVAEDRLEDAMAELAALLARQGAGAEGPRDLRIDGSLSPAAATAELVAHLEAAGPFGQANPAPRLAFGDVIPSGARIVGQGHCQIRLSAPGRGGALAGIAFGARDSGIAELFEARAAARAPVHVAGRLEIDDWGGTRRAKLRIEDAAPAS
ncbi:single-stranded-DNA-specific exonuclease RecJ [Limibaculum sp. M0105]|uniref:Single-stranded-DNA-specific exonuclease RecJ n=1 Tax=Thermohalobaculum xanthum TaxID=2753746 RepID=A0A8J7SC96_9RHOB|nr:single-stranded-DNA-specific exonuclease RecJ [Thermohalobaculum xanthum]MBK0399332.1 single-stranded-DNA-specific exonuclease RecJ [Thermohalobaculum xanthum]